MSAALPSRRSSWGGTLDGVERIQQNRVTQDEERKEPSQSGERDTLGRDAGVHGVDPSGCVTWGDGGECLVPFPAPLKEADGVTGVRSACVGVPKPREKELFGRQSVYTL